MSIANFAVHLAFSTYPSGKELEFVQKKRQTFKEYIKATEECLVPDQQMDTYLYKPLIFHLFGTFDVVFISLIDSYKFCQRVFDLDNPNEGSTTSYQVITGICDDEYVSLEDIKKSFSFSNDDEQKLCKRKFVHITNFKVNNGFLIGNGNRFISKIFTKLSNEFTGTDIDFILLKSFNWSEIVLIQFGDDLTKMQKKVIYFREFSILDIEEDVVERDEICDNSLYGYADSKGLFGVPSAKEIRLSHVFADSHSYSGVDYFEFNKQYPPEVDNPYDNADFTSSVEFQVKPGHFLHLFESLKKQEVFDSKKLKFKNGKTDYLVKEQAHKKFLSNYTLNQVFRNRELGITRHIGKIKTNFLLDVCNEEGQLISILASSPNVDITNSGVVNFGQVLAKHYTINVSGLKENIKKIGISRQLREKILKVFSNYNNLIRDNILYGEFIELRNYLLLLKANIEEEASNTDRYFGNPVGVINELGLNFMNLSQLENKWARALEIFEDAYHNRVHNNYLYEDLNEFSIDFNSAVNQINSIHDFIVKNTNNVFFYNFKDQIIVTQNEVDSKSNAVNINYNVYHYLEPALIFTTLFKEIMNGFFYKVPKDTGGDIAKNKFDSNHYENLREQLMNELSGEHDVEKRKLVEEFDFFYFFSDIAKLSYSFLFDYDLYEYWSWAYFLQNSSLYQSSGLPDNALFQKELLRIALIKEVFNNDGSLVRCPAPEIFDLWQKNIENISEISQLIAKNPDFNNSIEKFAKFVLLDANKLQQDDNLSCHRMIGNLEKSALEELNNDEPQIASGIETLLPGKDPVVSAKRLNLLHMFNFIAANAILIKSSLEKNEAISVEDMFSDQITYKNKTFYSICAIGHATLSLFKDHQQTPFILRRDWKDGIPLSMFASQETKTMFIDPFGGFFYNCPELRRRNFGYINNIIDCLWDLAEIDKKRLF